MLGSHAPTHDPQPGLQNLPAIQESNSEIPETHDSQELEPPLRSNHRQLPRHPPRQVSGRRLAAVEHDNEPLIRLGCIATSLQHQLLIHQCSTENESDFSSAKIEARQELINFRIAK